MGIGWYAFVPPAASFALWLVVVMSAARMPEAAAPLGTVAPRADVVPLYRMFAWNGSLWGVELWGVLLC